MALTRYFMSQIFDHRTQFYIEHIAGVDNVEADKLSRMESNPMARLYRQPRPTDPTLQPFYLKNPHFTIDYQFINLNINNHAKYCFNIANLPP